MREASKTYFRTQQITYNFVLKFCKSINERPYSKCFGVNWNTGAAMWYSFINMHAQSKWKNHTPYGNKAWKNNLSLAAAAAFVCTSFFKTYQVCEALCEWRVFWVHEHPPLLLDSCTLWCTRGSVPFWWQKLII